jgi:hypothetical protein
MRKSRVLQEIRAALLKKEKKASRYYRVARISGSHF